MYASRRVAIVVLARAGSRRLPGKMLLSLGSGTVLSEAIERLLCCRLADEVVLATTRSSADDPLAQAGEELGLKVVRGSEEDVVARMLCAVDVLEERPHVVVRACADNPLLMPRVVDEAVAELVDTRSDVITPFEYATYPFGYGLVALTLECLQRIDREAEAPAYREHVENFCLERPQDFRIRYQVAPPQLDYPELCTTLDHPVDYARLKRLREALDGVPLERQPAALVEHLRGARVWIEGQSPPANGGAPRDYDLVLGTRVDPETRAPRGVVVVDRFEHGGESRYGLRYADSCGADFPRGPVFLDARTNTALDSPRAFLARATPLALPLLLAAPARPLHAREALEPPASKHVRAGARRGFAHPTHAHFPPRVAVDLADASADREPLEGLLEKLLRELERSPLRELVVCTPDGAAAGPGTAFVAQATRRLPRGCVRRERSTTAGDAQAVFREVALDAAGRLRTGGSGVQAEFASSSIATFWRSRCVRLERARVLNGPVTP